MAHEVIDQRDNLTAMLLHMQMMMSWQGHQGHLLIVSSSDEINRTLQPSIFHIGDDEQGFCHGSVEQCMKLIRSELKRSRALDTGVCASGIAALNLGMAALDNAACRRGVLTGCQGQTLGHGF